MSEVTGELGGQPILLENAATEATLYALLQATLATNSNKSESAKIQKAYEDALKRTTKEQQKNLEQNNKNRKAIQDEIERRDELNKRIEDEKEKRKKFMDGLRDVVGVLDSIGNVIGKTLSFALSTATPKVTDFTDALSGIPIIGPIIGAVGKAMQENIDIFRQLSAVGADFGGSMHTMRTMAARAGLPLGVFAKAITENSSALAQLGGSTTAGARIFTRVNASLQGPFQQGLARLGFSMEETAELTAGYLAIQTKLGRAQNMNQNELNESTKEHLLQLDMLARVHGMTRQEAQKALAEQLQDKRLKLFYQQIGGVTSNTGLFITALKQARPAFADGLADLMLNNGIPSATNEFAKSIALQSPRFVKLAMQLRTNSISQEEANRVIREETVRLEALGKVSGATQGMFANLGSGVFDLNAEIIGLAKYGAELTEEEKKQLKAKEDSRRNQANFDKALLNLRERMYVVLLPLISYVETNIEKIITGITNFIEEFITIMNSEAGFTGALTNAAIKVGEALKPILVDMFNEMLKNPELTSAIVLGLGALFVAPAVVAALATLFASAAAGSVGGIFKSPDLPSSGKAPGTKGLIRNATGTALLGYGTSYAGEKVSDLGFNNAGASLDIAGTALSGAAAGALIGSFFPLIGNAIGAAVGGTLGAGYGLYQNWDKFGNNTAKPASSDPKKPTAPAAAPAAATAQTIQDATSKDAMKARSESIVQIKELTTALEKLDYNKLIIPDAANKNIEIHIGRMRLLRGEVNALTTSFKNLNDTGLSKITKGINALSGEFKIFNDGFSSFKKSFEELDRTTERAALETMTGQLDRLNTNALTIATNTGNTATNTSKLRGAPGVNGKSGQ
jgi:hypothetical protein